MTLSDFLTVLGWVAAGLTLLWHRAQREKGALVAIDQIRKDFDHVATEILSLRGVTNQHTEILARTVAQLEGLEGRVSRTERQLDG